MNVEKEEKGWALLSGSALCMLKLTGTDIGAPCPLSSGTIAKPVSTWHHCPLALSKPMFHGSMLAPETPQ